MEECFKRPQRRSFSKFSNRLCSFVLISKQSLKARLTKMCWLKGKQGTNCSFRHFCVGISHQGPIICDWFLIQQISYSRISFELWKFILAITWNFSTDSLNRLRTKSNCSSLILGRYRFIFQYWQMLQKSIFCQLEKHMTFTTNNTNGWLLRKHCNIFDFEISLPIFQLAFKAFTNLIFFILSLHLKIQFI